MDNNGGDNMSERSSIGEKRLEYLDFANKAFTSGDLNQALHFIDNFLFTIKENSQHSKDVQMKFDEIETKKNETWLNTVKQTESMDQWRQTEIRYQDQVNLAVQVIRDKINACWNIAQTHGMFND
jgi:hypothetical protein